MSSKTEVKYRQTLQKAGFLAGAAGDLPTIEALKAALLAEHPAAASRPITTSLDPWAATITKALESDDPPGLKALWDQLARQHPEFTPSYSAMRRFAARLRKANGVSAKDVAIRVETEAGDVAQVDFGYVGKWFDPDTGRTRKAWVFVMVLGYSRHMFAKMVWVQILCNGTKSLKC